MPGTTTSRIVAVQALILLAAIALGTPLRSAESRPPYPYAIPDWHPRVSKKLERKVSFEFEGTGLRDALESLAKKAKVAIEFDVDPVDGEVNLIVKDMAASNLLRLIFATNSRYRYYLRKGGIAVVDRSTGGTRADKQLEYALLKRDQIDAVRRREFPTAKERAAKRKSDTAAFKKSQAEAQSTAKTLKKLEKAQIDEDLEDISLNEFATKLQSVSGLRVFVTPPKNGSTLRVSQKGKRNAKLILHDVLRKHRLGYRVSKNTVTIIDKLGAKPEYLSVKAVQSSLRKTKLGRNYNRVGLGELTYELGWLSGTNFYLSDSARKLTVSATRKQSVNAALDAISREHDLKWVAKEGSQVWVYERNRKSLVIMSDFGLAYRVVEEGWADADEKALLQNEIALDLKGRKYLGSLVKPLLRSLGSRVTVEADRAAWETRLPALRSTRDLTLGDFKTWLKKSRIEIVIEKWKATDGDPTAFNLYLLRPSARR